MTYCTSCGTPKEPGAPFCAGCGHQLEPAPSTRPVTTLAPLPSPAPDPPSRPSLLRQPMVALVTLVLLGGGIAAWATLNQRAAPSLASPSTLSAQPPESTPEGITDQADDPNPNVDPEDAAREQLTRQISLDRPQVQGELAEKWVPQLSSKRLDLVVDGMPYNYSDILNDHLALRSRYGARLVWSGDWSSFRDGDFYVTVATERFSTSVEANAWCDRQNIDAENCFAKRLSATAGPDGSTVSR